jgi:hypothetical protein
MIPRRYPAKTNDMDGSHPANKLSATSDATWLSVVTGRPPSGLELATQ